MLARTERICVDLQFGAHLDSNETFILRLQCMLNIQNNQQQSTFFYAIQKLLQEDDFDSQVKSIESYEKLGILKKKHVLFAVLKTIYKSLPNPYQKILSEGVRILALAVSLHLKLIQRGQSDLQTPLDFNLIALAIQKDPSITRRIKTTADLTFRKTDQILIPVRKKESYHLV